VTLHSDYRHGATCWRCRLCGHEKLVLTPDVRVVYCLRAFAHPEGTPRLVEMRKTATVVSRRTGPADRESV